MSYGKVKKIISFTLTLAAAILSYPAFTAIADDAVIDIEYDNLRELLLSGSPALKDSTDSYYTGLQNNLDMLDVLREEQDNMKFKAEQYKDNDEAAESYNNYRQNAAILGNTISRLEKQVTRATSTSGFLSTEKTIDSYEMSAQTLMNSYNQMLADYNTQVKSTEAAQAMAETARLKYQSGAGTLEELNDAENSLLAAQNQLESYRIQVQSLKESLLYTLGIDTNTPVIIGTIPDPDIDAILSTDFESDVEKAVGNNSQVQNARHTNAYTQTQKDEKQRNETVAEGTVRTDITDAYEQLMSAYQQYESACEAFAAAGMDYDALQRKRQAGMLTNAEYLSGEADYLKAQASKDSAAMNLSHAYDSYKWEVKGVI